MLYTIFFWAHSECAFAYISSVYCTNKCAIGVMTILKSVGSVR